MTKKERNARDDHQYGSVHDRRSMNCCFNQPACHINVVLADSESEGGGLYDQVCATSTYFTSAHGFLILFVHRSGFTRGSWRELGRRVGHDADATMPTTQERVNVDDGEYASSRCSCLCSPSSPSSLVQQPKLPNTTTTRP